MRIIFGPLARSFGVIIVIVSGLIAAWVIPRSLLGASKPQGAATCDAPEYFGVCDPYVPGTIIEPSDKKPILVATTWPGGPADKAGICAGDKIVAVNGVSEEKV
jgi:S1-C subfamily serine protease